MDSNICIGCGVSGAKFYCGLCETAPLCSDRCRDSVWPTHRERCAGKADLIEQTNEDRQLAWKDDPDYLTRFEVETQLGSGAFGQVWKARALATGEVFALKIITKADKLGNDVSRLKSLSAWPNCAPFVTCYYEHRRIPDPLYYPLRPITWAYAIRLSYVDGVDMMRFKCKPAEKMDVLLQLLDSALQGLIYVHGRDIVHGDLKPENLLIPVDAPLRIVIADFGLSCQLSSGKDTCEKLVGTPTYMAPEVAGRRALPSKLADVFSLGAAFYYLASGVKNSERQEPPWVQEAQAPILFKPNKKVHSKAMLKLSIFANFASQPRMRVLHRMLAWEAGNRPTAAEALHEFTGAPN